MNLLKKSACGLLLAVPIVYSSVASAGTIVIGKQDGAICILPLPELPRTAVWYKLNAGGAPCAGKFDDNVRTITFRDVPSATRVMLYDNATPALVPGCTRGNSGSDTFAVELKTVKKQTTTKNIELDHLPTYHAGQIIEPGLQMVNIDAQSHLRDRLSCVQIEISKAPPATPGS